MAEEHDSHRACVDVWMQGEAKDVGPRELVSLFERALAAMWKRAQLTLGEVTLAAIVDRVLYTTSGRFPVLRSLEVNTSGVRFDALKKNIDGVDPHELASGVRFTLLEFLTVLGHLTAEILTPALHAELARVTLGDIDAVEPSAQAQASSAITPRKLVRRS